ncbi:aspartate/glutamate racemase family protein [Neobacillus sp. CF12]|uniref:aspartate/glutamate racemase family protein n=1 Tax=Neobacillus sp. CF12 TaxID=3055864 RepID=UPI0025A0F844|nr:aspartate/glutamate racemase family protein [Neobacillus sp. CF12]MDM5330533.1 aspartate/glutamate racemase family protein [Neobacillus sp. CF12]
MKKKLAIIHTTPVTVESLKELANKMLGDCEIINIVDDSILPQLSKNEGNVQEIAERWESYAKVAQGQGADCILNACSSIGELVSLTQPKITIPIVRIDDAMAEYAVNAATKIGVAATLETTLKPTLELLKQKAAQKQKAVDFEPILVASAYQKLMANDKAGHDNDLSAALRELAKKVDIVVLAQASMARVVSTFPIDEQRQFVTSPELGMEAVKDTLKQ